MAHNGTSPYALGLNWCRNCREYVRGIRPKIVLLCPKCHEKVRYKRHNKRKGITCDKL